MESSKAGHVAGLKPITVPRRMFFWGLAMACAVAFAYGVTLHYPLIYDDIVNVAHNKSIRSLVPPWGALFPDRQTSFGGRPVTNWTFALSFAVSGISPWAHRVMNVVIHLLNGLILFGLVRRVLAREYFGPVLARKALPVAGFTAALWLLHPINTLAVTYITQRAESLMALFFLLTLYCALRSWEERHGIVWALGAASACILGAGSKEVICAAPCIILLFDWLYVSGSPFRALRRSPVLYGGLLVGLLVLGALTATGRQAATGSLVEHPAPLGYAVTQAGVMVHYVRQALWPTALVFDYAWPMSSLEQVWPQVFAICAVLALTVWGVMRRKSWAFALCCFFLSLAPTSSFLHIPLNACEYRMYLPLTFLIVLGVAGLFLGAARLRLSSMAPVSVCICACVLLGGATWERNQVFADPLRLWLDTARKQPESPQALAWVGDGLIKAGRPKEALDWLQRSLALRPAHYKTLDLLGLALYLSGKPEEAVHYYQQALRLVPDYPPALEHLAAAALQLERLDLAKDTLDKLRKIGVETPLTRKMNDDYALLLEKRLR